MKLKEKMIYGVVGFLVGNSILLAFFILVYVFGTSRNQSLETISVAQAQNVIKTGAAKKVSFNANSAEIDTVDGRRLQILLGSDPVRELLLSGVSRFNEQHPDAKIAFGEESSQMSLSNWILLLNGIPILLGIVIVGLLSAILVLQFKKSSIH